MFGGSASYDTGDDATVRVTVSDVRKRLLQHYGLGAASGIRINLPSGSYIPGIVGDTHGEMAYKWQMKNGEAFIFTRADWEHVLNPFCFG